DMKGAPVAATNKTSEKSTEKTTPALLTCPECGRSFTRAAALGAHRKQAHGVAGSSANAASNRRRSATSQRSASNSARRRTRAAVSNATARTIDRDALLRALFPDGIPPREDVIGAANDWLNEADRLARLR